MKELIELLEKRYSLKDIKYQRANQVYFTAPAEHLVDLVTALKDVHGFTHLAFVTVVDRIEEGLFRLLYMVHNHETHTDFGVQTEIPREGSTAESIHHLWAQGATYQRELYEMYGISFPGSPRMTDPFVLESWDGPPPMRREFDTRKYSEETYYPRPGRTTHDPVAYMAEKLEEEGAAHD